MSAFRNYRDLARLTLGEAALLDALQQGMTINLAADALGIKRATAGRRLEQIRSKFGVNTTAQAIEKWREIGGLAA